MIDMMYNFCFLLFLMIYSITISTSSPVLNLNSSSIDYISILYNSLKYKNNELNNLIVKDYKFYNDLPWCTPQNLKLSSLSDISGDWFFNKDGTFSYYFSHCKLKIFTREQANQCLKGHHLGFVGDSLSRYFALNLMYLFAQNKWSERLIHPENYYFNALLKIKRSLSSSNVLLKKKDEKEKKMIIEKKVSGKVNVTQIINESPYKNNNINNYLNFNSWNNFYEGSSILLNKEDEVGISRVICDCFSSAEERRDNHFFHYINKNEMIEMKSYKNIREKYQNEIKNDVRISFVLWYGSNLITGDKLLTFSPYVTSHYNEYKEIINNSICKFEKGFIPFKSNCIRSFQGNHFPDSFSASACDSYEYDYISNYSFNNNLNNCEAFDRDILGGLGITNLILNFGLHVHQIENTSMRLLKKTINTSRKYFVPPRNSNRIHLPQVTWRDTTATAKKLYFEEEVNSIVNNKTLNSWRFSLNNHEDKYSHKFFVNNFDNPYYQYNFNYSYKLDSKYETFYHTIKEDDLKLDRFNIFNITNKLVRLKKFLKFKKYEKDFFNEFELNLKDNNTNFKFDLNQYHFLKESTELLTINTYEKNFEKIDYSLVPKIFVDYNHFEPWVYNEINNIFLNSICPHNLNINYSSDWN